MHLFWSEFEVIIPSNMLQIATTIGVPTAPFLEVRLLQICATNCLHCILFLAICVWVTISTVACVAQ